MSFLAAAACCGNTPTCASNKRLAPRSLTRCPPACVACTTTHNVAVQAAGINSKQVIGGAQFGKVDTNIYIMDYNPAVITAAQAFSISLSTFDSKVWF